ncbi:hypothetical protein ID866_5415 [Astraeus odoratus]|nr:hypothetical protein ID866_5415 [Astraeus odoratus]
MQSVQEPEMLHIVLRNGTLSISGS